MERAKTNVLNWLSHVITAQQAITDTVPATADRLIPFVIPLVVIPEDGYKLEATHRWDTRLSILP